MKKVFENILSCNDTQVIKNCVAIMADCCEVGMNDSVMLDMMKQVKGEVGRVILMKKWQTCIFVS